jgi:hypothetical protein
MVRRDGHRGAASVEDRQPRRSTSSAASRSAPALIKAALPAGFNIDLVGDQSVFVRSAISGVVGAKR